MKLEKFKDIKDEQLLNILLKFVKGFLILIFTFVFLMPEKEVRKVFEEKDGNLKAIAEYFNVSLATANRRLIILGLKDEK